MADPFPRSWERSIMRLSCRSAVDRDRQDEAQSRPRHAWTETSPGCEMHHMAASHFKSVRLRAALRR